MGVQETLGKWVGATWAPAARVGSTLRHARVLHPEGLMMQAHVQPVPVRPALAPLAQRLSGAALVRLSTALWRGGREWPDILGLAVRFRKEGPLTEEAQPGDQDLLCATLRSPWTLGLAPLTTQVHDWLANDYYGVSPFEVEGLGRAKLRLVAQGPGSQGALGTSRVQRLLAAAGEGHARFALEVQPLGGASAGVWSPVVQLVLGRELQLDPARLRFSPFRSGRGLRPVGFVHSLRVLPYRESQAARARH
ncbi:hypothetical protein FGE12_21815 [Aggregicoccus sp. 17bor-14]|uniref:hypothetical protein n=1 Tax=Myxococcaceae TaxID=31 RepID=UPI00129C5BA7|nr:MULTISPECIES: hypothetical protein [Myxococcaceae]MBF5045055.1 hypothetical protein [Simulacricoccus sp. 17bor-14]MRI90797.1 hypothetical protein [Aggregicoccus sp. 17bor-14]